MNYKKSLIKFLVIMVFVTALTLYTAKNRDKVIIPGKGTPTISVRPTISDRDYSKWTLFRNGYAFPLPPGWKNTSDTGGTAVLEAGSSSEGKIGSIYKITVTVLSDEKATGQRFTTQREFEEWSKVEGEVQGPIQRIDNRTVDGEKAIELLDVSGGENEWMIITWVRKDNKNVYINFKGNKKYERADAAAIDHILSNFTFTTPQITGSKK